jgi:two-component system chemotaxis response regulator CheY
MFNDPFSRGRFKELEVIMTYQDDVVSSNTPQLPVLVIDDVKSARAVLCDMLNELGFRECLEAQDGFEALEILRRTPVQLIL